MEWRIARNSRMHWSHTSAHNPAWENTNISGIIRDPKPGRDTELVHAGMVGGNSMRKPGGSVS